MGQRTKVTSSDVARAARVSQATVSRAFTEGASISKERRDHILKVARELGYEPNAIARTLTSQRSNLVGIVIAHGETPLFFELLMGVSAKLQSIGKQALLFSVSRDRDVDEALPRLLQYQVDGVIIISATMSSEIAGECKRRGIPVVLMNRYVRGARVSAVCCDNIEGGRAIANLLLDAGYRRLGYIAGVANSSTNQDREKGFFSRADERGAVVPLREDGEFTREGAYKAAMRLLTRSDPPDAIFCANDVMALGALDAARRELRLRIPEDVAIVGFDDIPQAGWPEYQLTTIRQPVEQMVDGTIDLLSDILTNGEAKPTVRLLPGALILRHTTRAPRIMGHYPDDRFVLTADIEEG